MKLGFCLRIRLENLSALYVLKYTLLKQVNLSDSYNLKAIYEN
jgi:hypothetical protein